MYFYKTLVCSLLLFLSFNASALTCTELAKIADDNAGISITKYTYTVQGKNGFRTYFHSAPSSQCKIKDLFITPKDSVIAYSYFRYENRNWMYVMYLDKNGNETSGWVLEKDFKQSGRINTPLN